MRSDNIKIISCVEPLKLEYLKGTLPDLISGQTLLKIKKIGICGTDIHAFGGTQPFFTYPRILGHELSGEIVETDDIHFEVGESVTIIPYVSCGHCIACRSGKTNCCASIKVHGVHVDGGMAEFMVVPTTALIKSEGLTLDELALVEPLAIGAHAVRRANIQAGEFVLVVGAGPIGLGAMEFARIEGANVIAMDMNSERLKFCREKINITSTIDISSENPVERLIEITNGDMPTVVFDATGNLNAINQSFNFIGHGGRYVLIGLQKGDISFSHPEFHKREASLMSSRNATKEDFAHVVNCIKDKRIDPSVYITHKIQFDELVEKFNVFLDSQAGVVKAIVEL